MRRAPLPSSEDGRSALEAVIVLSIVAALLMVALNTYYTGIKSVRETALTIELSNLRRAVTFYATLNKKLPDSLETLLDEEVVVPKATMEGDEYMVVIAGRFIESMTVDGDGNILDPFGNPFSYDPGSGEVRTTTPGYETW